MNHFVLSDLNSWMNISTNNTCPDGIPWIKHLFGQCVLDVQHYTAVICGIVSIIAWLLNGLPQMVENCRRGIPDEAVSPWLLIFWTIGDTCNLIGCILTHQLPLQKWSAAYSIVCDVILISQFIYALIKHKRQASEELLVAHGNVNVDYNTFESTTSTMEVSAGSRALACVLGLWTLAYLLPRPAAPIGPAAATLRGRRLLYYHPVFIDPTDIIGYVLGVASSIFYFSARIPQLMKNFMRKTTDGLSIGLFILAVVGNSTYGLQIFLTSVDSVFLIRHAPWLVGSLGVLSLDFVMLFQFFLYRNAVRPQEEDKEESEEIIPHPSV